MSVKSLHLQSRRRDKGAIEPVGSKFQPMLLVGATAIAIALAFAVRVTHARTWCRAACGAFDAPVLTNPGTQSDPATLEYGYAAAVLSGNPIGYWRLEDFVGTTISDSSSTPHDGTVVGTIARAQAGALADGGVAMRFSGISGTRIDVQDEPFRLTGAVTVEAWMKADGAENTGSLFEKSVGGSLSYRLAQEGGSWTWKISGTFGELQCWTAVVPEDVGAWVHLAGTFDGVTTKLYKNGVLVHSRDAAGSLTTGSGVSRIGALANEGYPLAGALDEVAVYGTALTAGQIANHYALRTSVPAVSLQLAASDPETDPLTYTATGLPPGLLLNPLTGLISGNPTTPGTYTVTATAKDPEGLTSEQTFVWTIEDTPIVNPNRPLVTNPGSQTSQVTQQHGYAGAVLAANPVGYWRLDDYSGTTVADWSGHAHHGTLDGGIVHSLPGALADGSLAMHFDGALDTKIDIEDDAAFALSEAITVEVWANTEQAYATGQLFDKSVGSPTNASYRLMQEGDMWVWQVVGTFGTLNRWTPVTSSDIGSWVHLVGTFDGKTTRLYKNGVLMQSHAAEGTLTTGAGMTRIGLLSYDAFAFPGMIDEVAVYSSALDAGQIASHYALRTGTSSVSLEIEATEPDDETLSFSASGLPPGLLINPVTGEITGNPRVPGIYHVAVTARDPGGLGATETFTWTISSTPTVNPNRPLLTNPGDQASFITTDYGYPTAVLPATPVGYWRLDDPSGSTVVDRATVPHHGTLQGGVTRTQSGALADGSTAMRFDGVVGSRVEIPAAEALALTNALTVELWAKPDGQSSYGGLFDKTIGGSTDQSYELLQENQRWAWWIYGSFGVVNVWTPVEAEDVGTWVHLVATFDGTTTKLYKNGVLVGSESAEGTITGGEGVAFIGHLGSNIFPFAGAIDEVSVYGTALSSTQITTNYARRTATSAVSLQLTASDPDGDALTYRATGLPSTLVLNPVTGTITGNPTAPGVSNVTATVTDPGGLSASRSFTWTFTTVTDVVSTPTISPNGGNFSSSQSVTLSTTTPSAIIRYTLDDTSPTAASPQYTAALTIAASTVVKARAYRTGWVTSDLATATFALNYGTLATPTASIPGGSYASAPRVVLYGPSGATVRYTTDGIDPTATSPAYTQPLIIGAGTTTLKARAFKPDWDPSAVLSETYVVAVDTVLPMLQAVRTPSPNLLGWNNSDVTVHFSCKDAYGIATCPNTVTVTNDTAEQVVSGTAIDVTGNEASVSVSVKIDRTVPALTLDSPTGNIETTTASISISGTVSEALSGLFSVTCQGVDASVTDGTVSCTVPLQPGRNEIVLQAVDYAGNNATKSVRVLRTGTPTTLAVSPARRTLALGQTKELQLHSEFGAITTGVTWESSNASVVSVTGTGAGVITAEGVGEATITATSGGQSAEATISVLTGGSGGSLPAGTERWGLTPTPGMTVHAPIYATKVDDDGPDLFVPETLDDSGFPVAGAVKALRSDGTLLWTLATPLGSDGAPVTPMAASVLGGVIAADGAPGYSNALVRLAAGGDGTSWRYTPQLAYTIGEVAQASDGTLYFTERRYEGYVGSYTKVLVALNGNTGAVKFKVPIPESSYATFGAHECYSPGTAPVESRAGHPVIGPDDAVYLEVVESHYTLYLECQGIAASEQEWFHSLRLMRIAPNGSTSATPLFELFQSQSTLDREGWNDLTWPTIGRVTPDGRGGVMAKWTHISQDSHTTSTADYSYEQRFSRVVGNAVSEYSWQPEEPENFLFDPPVTTVDGRLYVQKGLPSSNESTLMALDVETFMPVWTRQTKATPIVALDDDTVMLQDPDTGTIETANAEGTTVASVTTSLTDVRSLVGGQAALHGFDTATGAVAEIAVDEFCVAEFSYLGTVGNSQRQNRPDRCNGIPPYSRVRKGLVPGLLYTYRFDGADWTNAKKNGVREAFRRWSRANLKSGLNTVFEEFVPAEGETPSIALSRGALEAPDPNKPIGGSTVSPPRGDGTVVGGDITFSNNPAVINGEGGYLKVGLHEIGHLLGLGDNHGFNGSSVMNQLGADFVNSNNTADDPRRNMPLDVTSCDRDRAKLAAETTWPRPQQ